MAAWSERNFPAITGPTRCFTFEAGDYEGAVAALANVGMVEQYDRDLMRAMAMRPTTKTSAAIIVVVEALRSPDGNHEWESDEEVWLSTPDGDYEAALAALRWAGFSEVECPSYSG